MKTYESKEAVYQDFSIALKFGLERPVHVRDYEELFDAFARDCRAKLTQFSCTVANYRTQYPISAGFFVEIPVKGDTGQEIGTRVVLLEHETGWEFFIPLASALAAWLGPKIAEKVAGKALDAAIAKLASFMKEQWPRLIRGGVRIDHVEIRTESKGVMRIPFSSFNIDQLRRLIEKFPSISHLRECNAECFGGMLVDLPSKSAAPLASD
ncbi:MAG: hypothetical protein ACRERD_16755 [Candidatus Binatia bacterium]